MTTFQFEIFGNQDDPSGNPIAYHRTTQRAKWKDPGARRYLRWKAYVVDSWLEKFGKYPDFHFRDRAELNVICYFKNCPRHADPENVRKGIQDALFINDQHVAGRVDFFCISNLERGFVSITVDYDPGVGWAPATDRIDLETLKRGLARMRKGET